MSDLCFERPALARVLRQAETMDRMMARVGVAPGVAVRLERGGAFYEARSRCIACVADARCRAWLGDSGVAPPPDFCPNAAFLARCLATAAGTPRIDC